jgi:methylated-DNA-[protein]-cysteine S-methyltransferase
MVYYTTFDTPLCPLVLVEHEKGLTNLHMDTGAGRELFATRDTWTSNPRMLGNIQEQILEYMEGRRKVFSVPLDPQGTPFQKKVWQALGNTLMERCAPTRRWPRP